MVGKYPYAIRIASLAADNTTHHHADGNTIIPRRVGV